MHDITPLPAAGVEPVRFGRVPVGPIDAGRLVDLSRAEAMVYLVLARHVGRSDWRTWPAVETIAAKTGLASRSVKRALAGLRCKSLILVDRAGGGRGRTTTYRLDVKGDALVTVSERETVTQPGAKGDATRPEKVTGRARKGDARVTPRDKKKHRKKPEEETGGQARNAAADRAIASKQNPTKSDAGVMNALAAAGVGEPKRSELAQRPGVTVRLIDQTAGQARAQGKGTGWLILRIGDKAAEAVARAERQKRHDVEVERQRRARAAERAAAPPPLTVAQKQAIRDRVRRDPKRRCKGNATS